MMRLRPENRTGGQKVAGSNPVGPIYLCERNFLLVKLIGKNVDCLRQITEKDASFVRRRMPGRIRRRRTASSNQHAPSQALGGGLPLDVDSGMQAASGLGNAWKDALES
jgi:hypothetical protein